MDKMDLDQVESTKNEEVKQNEGQETSSSGTNKREFNSSGDVQHLKLDGNEGSSKQDKKMKLQVNGEEEDVEMDKSQEENPFGWSPENLELAQKALAIELILIKVLENLPTKSLVNFRLVNKTWEKEATNIIMKGSKTRLEFGFYSKIESKIDNDPKLSNLNECIRKSHRFPCSSFNFSYAPFGDADLTEFFTLHGSEIKCLELFSEKWDSSKLGHLLLHQVPNVEKLIVRSNKDNEPASLFPKNTVLSHLKSLDYCLFPFATEIIRASPNLKQVFKNDWSWDGVETLMSMNKIHLLKEISIGNDYQNTVLYERLAEANPKLEHIFLTLPFDPPGYNEFLHSRFVNAVSTILESSKETLAHAHLCLDNELFVQVKWPRLENVSDLILSSSEEENLVEAPANFISSVFPNVRKLKNDGEYLPSIFNCASPLTKLTTYESSSLYGNSNLDGLSLFAPNLKNLNLGGLQNFHKIANLIWSCSGLKELQIELSAEYYSSVDLDMAFTGLSKKMVKKLHKNQKYFNKMKMNKKEIPRPNPSIWNCPDLTALKIKIDGEINDETLMTAVTGEFGFKMLENLQVEIQAEDDILPSLDALKPYGRFVKYSIC